MIAWTLLAATAALPLQHGLQWEGTAEVHAPGGDIAIAVKTRIARDGSVVSESWPVSLGKAKGLRRMIITPAGGWIERGGKREPMPAAMLEEERAQFDFYRQLQVAHKAGGNACIEGRVRTCFESAPGRPTITAYNVVRSDGKDARQFFRITSIERSRGAIFPREMLLLRDGQPYFSLHVKRFDAR